MWKSLFEQHEKTRCHRIGIGTATARAEAPSDEHFAKTYLAARERSTTRPIPGVSNTKKTRKMVYCLAEAARQLDRDFISTATCMTIMQDVRKSRLLVRFRASAPKMKTRCGILGFVRVPEGGALSLRDGTLEAFKQTVSRFANAPMSKRKGSLKLSALQHALDITCYYTADAAGDEQLAGHILKDGFSKENIPKLLKNLRIIIKDRAHATRRLGKRGWMADTYLKNVLQMIVYQRKSIVSLIQNSDAFGKWFQDSVDAMNNSEVKGTRIRNLSLAHNGLKAFRSHLAERCFFLKRLSTRPFAS